MTKYSYWKVVWKQFKGHPLGTFALIVVLLFCLLGIYAPFLASSKPIIVQYNDEWFFPLFRYLFYRGFYTKRLDLFYNLLMFTLPAFLSAWFLLKANPKMRKIALLATILVHFTLFLYFSFRTPQDPAANSELNKEKQQALQQSLFLQKEYPLLYDPAPQTWEEELKGMNSYAKLNMILKYQQRKNQMERLQPYAAAFAQANPSRSSLMPILWNLDKVNEENEIERINDSLNTHQKQYKQARLVVSKLNELCALKPFPTWMQCDFLSYLPENDKKELINEKQAYIRYKASEARLKYIIDRNAWLKKSLADLKFEMMPLLRPFHWEEDAGGSQELNQYIPWWELTRITRKDMVSALVFGVRISLSVGLLAVGLALLIGIPIGALSGYYGGKIDIITYRLIEIWESMPTFFMLLMVVAFLQSKSIFIVITVIGLFGWTGFSRFVRGEFFKQKQLPYVEACKALGFNDGYIMFSHLLPNAIPPLLTLVPFAIMGAITSEAGLSFLGLGEEGSGSWGVLMDEGRSAFPAESYLLWPPAILLTIFLVAIALVGDSLRDSLDPKLHQR